MAGDRTIGLRWRLVRSLFELLYRNRLLYWLASTIPFAGQWRTSLVLDTAYQISSFGEDDAGELYVVDLTGAVYRFDPTS